jgi:hypothetical protein
MVKHASGVELKVQIAPAGRSCVNRRNFRSNADDGAMPAWTCDEAEDFARGIQTVWAQLWLWRAYQLAQGRTFSC